MRRTEGIPLTRVSQFIQVTTALEECGTSPERLLRRLNMPMWHYCDPDAFLPLGHIFTLMGLATETAGMETFGMRVMECVPFQRMGMIGTLTMGAPTLYQALKTFVRLVPSHGSSKRYWLSEGRDHVWLCRGGKSLFEVGEREMIQYALTAMVQIIQLGAGPGWRPSKVKVQAVDTLGLKTTEMFSEAQIFFDPEVSAVAIPRSILSLPVRPTNRTGASSYEISEKYLQAFTPVGDFATSLRAIVATQLSEGCPQIEVAAEIVGVHVRTLQRILAEDGLTYRQMIDEARFETATRKLKEPDATVTDVAFDLGYADAAHFTRAFRRWAGVSPREYRRLASASWAAVDRAGTT